MKRRTRIISLILSLALIFGCMPLTLLAADVVPEELTGGAITEEDVASGKTDALVGAIPEANGILSANQIKALIGEANVPAVNECDTKGTDTNNFQTVVDETSSGGRKYIKVSEAAYTINEDGEKVKLNKFTCGANEETFVQLNNPYVNNNDNVAKNYLDHKGKPVVISADIRLEENYSISSISLVQIRCYLAASNGALSNIAITPVTLKNDGSLVVSGVTLEKKVNKSTAENQAEFTNIAIHILPEDNTFEVYVDGVLQTGEIDSVLLGDSNNTAMTFDNVKHKVGGVEYTVSAAGHKDFLFSWARFMHIYKTNYHGYDCPDTCTSTACYEESFAPYNFNGDQFSLDNMKAYYSDIYLECTNHDIAVADHTHNEENITSAATFTCNNCSAAWNVSVPMDQTGNALCDLCEINNANTVAGELHTVDQINSYINQIGEYVKIESGAEKFDNGGDQIKTNTEDDNTYYVLGSTTEQFFNNITGSDCSGADTTRNNYNITPYKGKSFVIQTDLRLGEDFKAENQSFELFKIFTYCTNQDTTNSTLESIYPIITKISGSGKITARDGATGSYIDVATLSADKFTSFAIHVKTAASSNTCGSYDVYVDGKLVKADIQFLTVKETELLKVDAKVGNYDIKIDGIKDYCLASTRFFHTYASAPLTNDDVLHIDNMMSYFAETYTNDFTQHDMLSEHVHDYSKNLVNYGSYCTLCGAGSGGVAVLDANDDKLCDVCVNEQIDTTAGEIIDPADLSGIIGTSNVVVSSTITDTTPFGFSSVANSAGCITAKTEDGNTYIQYIGKQASGESYVNLTTDISGSANTIKNFNNDLGYNGKSYVFSIDIRLGTEFNQTQNLSQTLAYMVPNATNDAGQPTSFTSLNLVFTRINSVGELEYRVATETSSSYSKVSGFKLDKGAEKFTTIAMHVRPADGDYGLYSIYVDGVCVVSDVQFLTKTESDSIAWTLASGKSSRGVKDYVLGFIRSCPLFPASTLASSVTDFLSLDNPKLYYSENYIECTEHKFAMSEHTHDLENQEIVIDLACPCGECDAIRLPIDTVGNGKCDTCGTYLLSGGAEVTGRQVILGDLIGLKLFAKIHEDLVNDPTAKVVVRYGENTLEFIPSEMTKNKSGEYEFDIQLTSVEMSADVSIAVEIDGKLGNAYTTNVRDYAMSLLETSTSEYEKELCRAMLNYGAYAQMYFAEKHGDTSVADELANALLDEKYTDVSYVTESTLADYAFSTSGTENGAAFTSATLILDTDTTLKIFFAAPADAEVAVNGNEVTPNVYGYEYFIEIGGLLPQHLDDAFTVAITADGKTVSTEISVLTAVHALLISGESDSFKALGKAIYLYNLAAIMYTAEKAEAEIVVKDNAKGAVALVLDDGNQTAADYAASYMQKYDKTVASFALIASHFATFQKDSDGNYIMSEDGKYTYTQTANQELKTQYWYDFLEKTDINGNALGDRTELISHSYTHALPKDGDNYAELLGARHILQGLFGYNTEALITPGGFDKNEEYNAVKEAVYLAARATNASTSVLPMINTLSEFDPSKRERMDSFMVQYNKLWLTDAGAFSAETITAEEALNASGAANGIADVSHVEDFIDCAMENGGLAAFCIHGIVPTTYNGGTNESGLHIYDEQADAIFAYVQKHAETGDLWAATYSDAVKYFCEWNTSTLDVRKIGDGKLAVSLVDKEDDSVCDMELTVKVSVDDSWTSVVAAQGFNTEVLEVMGDAGAKYVLVNILPDSGIMTLTKA